jgi:hypothetical protein
LADGIGGIEKENAGLENALHVKEEVFETTQKPQPEKSNCDGY